VILTGLGLAALGFAGRYAVRVAPVFSQKMADAVKSLPKMDAQVNYSNINLGNMFK
jgi:DnaJ family protein C protein 19